MRIGIARKIIEAGKQEDLIPEQPNQVIKKPKQPEPPTSAIQVRCRVCGAPKGALCKPVNGWVGTGNLHRARVADFECYRDGRRTVLD